MSTNADATPTSPDSIPKFNTATNIANGKGINEMMDSLQSIITQLKAGTLASGKLSLAALTSGTTGQVLGVTGGTPAWQNGYGAQFYWNPFFNNSTGSVGVNIAYLIPIDVIVPSSLYKIKILCVNSSAVGSLDFGVYYSDDLSTFTRMSSLGSTTLASFGGASVLEISNFGGTLSLVPAPNRHFFLAFGCTSATPTWPLVTNASVYGVYTKNASFPLPSTLTGMSAAIGGPFPVLSASSV